MEDRSARIETKIDKLTETLSDMREVWAADKEAGKDVRRRVGELERDMKPVKRHVALMHGIGLVAGVAGIKAIISYLSKG